MRAVRAVAVVAALAGCSGATARTFPAHARAPIARDASVVLAPGLAAGQRFAFEDRTAEHFSTGGNEVDVEIDLSGVYEVVAAEAGIPSEIRATFEDSEQRVNSYEIGDSLAGRTATFRAGATGDIKVDYPGSAEGMFRLRIHAIGRTLIDRPLYLPADARPRKAGDAWETTVEGRRTRSRLVAVRDADGSRVAEIETATTASLAGGGYGREESTMATIFCDVATGALLTADAMDDSRSRGPGTDVNQRMKRRWRAKRIVSPAPSP